MLGEYFSNCKSVYRVTDEHLEASHLLIWKCENYDKEHYDFVGVN